MDDKYGYGLEYCAPILKEIVSNIEKAREQSFKCLIDCTRTAHRGCYRYLKKQNTGIIFLQEVGDPRYLIFVFSHEICHYAMENFRKYHNPSSGLRISSYEEVFADVFAISQLKLAINAFRQWNNGFLVDLLEEYLKSLYQDHRLPLSRLQERGVPDIPLLDESLLPLYDNCMAVALHILPCFENNPELWGILKHVQQVHPLQPWDTFLDYLRKCADGSYEASLENLINCLLP